MVLKPVFTLLFQGAAVVYLLALLFYVFKQYRWAGWTVTLGLLVHTTSQTIRCWRYGFFTLEGAFHAGFFLPWCLAALIVVAWQRNKRQDHHILSALWPLVVVSALVIIIPPTCHNPTPFTPTWSAYLFFIFESLAHACFIMSGWLAVQFLLQRHPQAPFHAYAVWGFVCFSLAQLAGCAWTYLGWGGLFRWGTRHMHSAALWCFYCSYLHTAYLKGFGLRNKARFALAGTLIALVLFYALPLVPRPGRTQAKQQAVMNHAQTAPDQTISAISSSQEAL